MKDSGCRTTLTREINSCTGNKSVKYILKTAKNTKVEGMHGRAAGHFMSRLVAPRDKLRGEKAPPSQDSIILGCLRYHVGEGPCFLCLHTKIHKRLVWGVRFCSRKKK